MGSSNMSLRHFGLTGQFLGFLMMLDYVASVAIHANRTNSNLARLRASRSSVHHKSNGELAINEATRTRRMTTVTGVWSQGPPMPDSKAMAEVASAIVDSTLYVIGGIEDYTMSYDIIAGTWSHRDALAKRPYAGDHHTISVVRNQADQPELYVLGGFNQDSEQTVQVYNIENDVWREEAPLPWDVHGSLSSVVINNKIYVCGGLKLSFSVDAGENPSDCYSFDPETQTWSKFANMLFPVDHAAFATDGAKMFIFGGRTTGHNIPAMGTNKVQIYDPTADSWTEGTPMPDGRGGGGAAYVDGVFIVLGGESRTQVYGETYYFDGLTWFTTLPDMISPRHGISPMYDPVSQKVYVSAGGVKQGPSKSDLLEILSLDVQGAPTLQPTTIPGAADTGLSSMTCEELGWTPSQELPRVCPHSFVSANGKCLEEVTHTQAHQVCEDRNARLCTTQELEYNAAVGSGCRLDRKRIWTKDACGSSDGTQFFVIGGSTKFENRYPSSPNKECTDVSSLFPVRCCADNYIRGETTDEQDLNPVIVPTTSALTCAQLGWGVRSTTPKVCAGSFVKNGNCVKYGVTYAEAVDICSAAGARMCSPSELKKDVAKGSGCTLDRTRIWSSKVCGDGSQYVVVGASSKYAKMFPHVPIQECVDASEEFPLRCCADTIVATPAPIVQSNFVTRVPTSQPTTFPTTPLPTRAPAIVQAPRSTKSCAYLQWTPLDGTEICGDSKVNPQTLSGCTGEKVSQAIAKQACEIIGARLCTTQELKNDVARDTGCALDRKRVWTSDECSTGFKAAGGSTEFITKYPDLPFSECTDSTTEVDVRCCGDVVPADVVPTVQPTSRPTKSPVAAIYAVPQIGKWTNFAPPFDEELQEGQGLAVADKLWVFGGFTDGLFKKKGKDTFSYTPADDTWRKYTPIPIVGGLSHAGQATEGDNVYIIGGMLTLHADFAFPNCVSTSLSFKYNTITDTWTSLPDLPAPRAGGGCVYNNGFIHFFGGGTFVPYLFFTADHAEHWILDVSDPTSWVQKKSISKERNHMGAAAFGGKVYAIGGQYLENEWQGNYDIVERYNPDDDEWTLVTSLPYTLGHITPGVFSSDYGIFVLGGYSNGRERLKHNLFFYSPIQDEWTELSALVYGPSQISGIIDGKIYALYRLQPYWGQIHWLTP
eukprot:m.54763 g.54763  ORF g.54763 m.54763 type:complete len:1161 (-) comp21970_c0_seq1:84-3566(-)